MTRELINVIEGCNLETIIPQSNNTLTTLKTLHKIAEIKTFLREELLALPQIY